ncbi:MAG: efflux system, inner rane transporter CmeB [Phenylobacterium sp.]|nr:efflux system, inner rane transporter CmeB [Phenylobacterium sp.]
MSRFFIERPIFAWVIAIVIMLAGALAIRVLPIAQYPDIAPPGVIISATYPGASPQTVENTVTQVIEQQLNGLDGMEYFASTSDSTGSVTITVTFRSGVNPDTAQVQVQNKLQLALPRLPQEVQQAGVVVQKAQTGFLMVIALYDESRRLTAGDLGDYIVSNLQDPLSRLSGVGNVQLFGGQYAMRIWLDPLQLNNYKLTAADVKTAILGQNAQVAAGQLGAEPYVHGQQLNATVNAQSRLQTPEQFRNIILRTSPTGALVRLSDVAKVELGNENYNFDGRFNRYPAGGLAIQLAPGANALDVAREVKAKLTDLSRNLPPGVKLAYPYDTTPFVRLSIEDVAKTLIEAIILVVIVMFVFLQSWRATLIPAIAVPVVLLGTFGVLAIAGYTINTLTMFGMVLAIGLLVDDAIVVVENVERVMAEEKLSPKEATAKSMQEITGALIGIALVLTAVFLPMAFFGGSTGVIYRQFSITIVSAMVLSVLVALVLTPALCATLLKAPDREPHAQHGFFGWFNRTFTAATAKYQEGVRRAVRRPRFAFGGYAIIVLVMGLLFISLPTGFVPEEDQGVVISMAQLPAGAISSRTRGVMEQIEDHFLDHEPATKSIFSVIGFSFAGAGQNTGIAFTSLKDWKQRTGAKNHAPAIVGRAMASFARIRDAMAFALVPPSVQGLGQSNGFDFELVDRAGLGHGKLLQARNQLLGMAAKNPLLAQVRPNGQEDTPQLQIDVDQEKAGALSLSQADINSTLTAAWGGSYVNDFIDRGRVKRVYIQGMPEYRSAPEDLDRWYARNSLGQMIPFSAFATSRWEYGPSRLERYNGQAAFQIQGQAAPGKSSGAAMAEMEKLAAKLPAGVGYEWTGLSYQERLSGSQAPALYALSMLVVFLCLAALYESWSVPLSVMLVVPLGVVGAVLAAHLRGLANDVYFQVGLLTTIGLSAKNAILIVEFAEGAERRGAGPIEAALEGARLRLRPILMTSLAFVAGVAPLAIASGAGAGSQNDIGTGVLGGMISATVLAIFLVPVFFVVVRSLFRRRAGRETGAPLPGPDPSREGV